MNKEKAKKEIENLVEKYDKVIEENRVKEYNEEMTKKDFILPLFRALGWKVENSNEVTAEEKISKKRVDYGFRIGGIPKFFLEAKSLKVDLDEPKFFEQAVSYAWHKGCTWAVLTDFEAVKILNAEWKAANYLQSHFTTIHSNEFLKRFDELWLLSKESFDKDALDKKAEKWGKKTKKTSIDKQLLADFTRFRGMLSKNVTKLNQSKNLTEDELDESVQRILDRLIFIRNCEDRELEAKTLISKSREWRSKGKRQLVKSLRKVFDYFDKEYNSKIFAEHLCDHLEIEDAVLYEIIMGLYYMKEKYFSISYDFSVIDADVLGNIYEQYLSHILKKTGKRAKLTENRVHRKKHGIYYTPTYIVDYIVRNTLGELLKNKKIDVEKIRVLDAACGSGSFMIKAFDVLNEYHLENDKDYAQSQLDSETGAIFTKKAKILQNNIFGVDLDKQAVEIAQLNLLLKIAEKKCRLPFLEQNIKCGNSLIEDEKTAGDKAFKWEEEFKGIMKEGGFDVVIGNPPYGAELSLSERRFLLDHYSATKNNTDTAVAFINRGYDLLKKNGLMGLIVPKPLLYSSKWITCREFIKDDLVRIVDVGKAFEDVLLEQVIVIIKKGSNRDSYLNDFLSQSKEIIKVDKSIIERLGNLINDVSQEELLIAKKLNRGKYIRPDVADIKRGLIIQKFLKPQGDIPVLRGKSIGRYLVKDIKEFVTKEDYTKFSKKTKYLLKPKVIIQNIVAHVTRPKDHIILMSTIDEEGLLALDNVGCISIKDSEIDKLFLVAILNSTLMSWYAYRFIYSKAIRTMRLDKYHLSKMPLCEYKGKDEYEKTTLLAARMISLNKHLSEIGNKLTDERARIEEEIKRTDNEIDEQVYRIYGISEDEKKVIEESLK